MVALLLDREVALGAQVEAEQRNSLPRVLHLGLRHEPAPAARTEREWGHEPVSVVHRACLSQHKRAVSLFHVAAVLDHRLLRRRPPRRRPDRAVTATTVRLHEADRQSLVGIRLWRDFDVPRTPRVGAEQLCIRALGEPVKQSERCIVGQTGVVDNQSQRAAPFSSHEGARSRCGCGAPVARQVQHPFTVGGGTALLPAVTWPGAAARSARRLGCGGCSRARTRDRPQAARRAVAGPAPGRPPGPRRGQARPLRRRCR